MFGLKTVNIMFVFFYPLYGLESVAKIIFFFFLIVIIDIWLWVITQYIYNFDSYNSLYYIVLINVVHNLCNLPFPVEKINILILIFVAGFAKKIF